MWMSLLDRVRKSLFGDDDVEETPTSPEDVVAEAILKDEKLIKEFRKKLGEVYALKVSMSQAIDPMKEEVEKWERMKGVAASTGDEDAVRQAVEKRVLAEREVEEQRARIKDASDLMDELQSSLEEIEDRVSAARDWVPILEARKAGAEVREHLAKMDVDGAQSDSSEGAVAAFEEDVEDAEAHSAAYQEMSSRTATGASRVVDDSVDQKAIDAEVRAALEASK
jgi:phage shock protein A